MTYRALTPNEISVMKQNGCNSTDWNDIKVKDGFDCCNYVRVNFSGEIRLGLTDETVIGTAGIIVQSGIFDASLHNCTVGDNVHIAKVWERIINYDILDGAYITNIGSIICTGSRAFGNGTEVNVLNEQGGRSVLIFEELTAQMAYLMTFYRHDKEFITSMDKMIRDYAAKKKSAVGKIGKMAKITNLGSATDVVFDDESYTNSCSLLWDGTVGKRAFVGPNVVAEHFVFASEACVDKGAIVKNVFVGQKAELTNGFLANNSLFFANCIMEAGEAVSVFAGPHTVSMHRSTLLIGGMFSFFNAGSGTNQSNHLYRIGPVHQGIMERGCKTGSCSYIMWPARIGSFSLLTGKHYKHPDTSELPYSYVVEKNGKTVVLPGANLKKFGTIRDILKWKKRDHRSNDLPRLDIINYDPLTPLTTRKMYQGIHFLNLCETDPDYPSAHNFVIEHKSIRHGRELYALGVDFFMGEEVMKKLAQINVTDCPDSLGYLLIPESNEGVGRWVDAAGLIAPATVINELCSSVAKGSISSPEELAKSLQAIHNKYSDYKWEYVADNFKSCYGITLDSLTKGAAISILHRWTESVDSFDRERNTDAHKDFNENSMVSFGIDLDPQSRQVDFNEVRGLPEKNDQMIAVHNHYASLIQEAYAVICRLKEPQHI